MKKSAYRRVRMSFLVEEGVDRKVVRRRSDKVLVCSFERVLLGVNQRYDSAGGDLLRGGCMGGSGLFVGTCSVLVLCRMV